MSLSVKELRLKELYRIKFPSDEEIDEIMKLEEELELGEKEEQRPIVEIPVQQKDVNVAAIPSKRVRKSLYNLISDKFKKKPAEPATWDEIQQLKLEYRKAKLLHATAKLQADMPKKKSSLDTIVKLFSPVNQGPERRSSGKKQRPVKEFTESDYDRFKGLIGNNDPKKFKGLTG